MSSDKLQQILVASKTTRERTCELIATSHVVRRELASTMRQLLPMKRQPLWNVRSSALGEHTGPRGMKDNIAKASELQRESQRACVEFLRADLKIACTFAQIASEAGNHSERKQHNLANALKAYRTIMMWCDRLSRSEDAAVQIQDLDRDTSQLRAALQKLGVSASQIDLVRSDAVMQSRSG